MDESRPRERRGRDPKPGKKGKKPQGHLEKGKIR